MDADAHDRAVALVSHMPHLVSSMVAARLENAEEAAVRLCGQGIRDVTRIAASDPGCGSTSSPRTRARSPTSSRTSPPTSTRPSRPCGPSVLRRGQAARGRERHRGRPAPRQRGPGPRPRQARCRATDVRDGGRPHRRPARPAGPHLRRRGAAGVNIEDVRIEHATGQQAGLVQLMVDPKAAPVLSTALRERGWALRQ